MDRNMVAIDNVRNHKPKRDGDFGPKSCASDTYTPRPLNDLFSAFAGSNQRDGSSRMPFTSPKY
jgi:hypothetical protein